MNTVAQLPAKDRLALFTETAASLGLPPFHVEKDFWVCWVLAALFNHPEIGPNLTFRGGTSLSKAWGVIERFSEDVDLAMSRDWLGDTKDPGEVGITSSEKTRRQKSLRGECREMITNQLIPALHAAANQLPEAFRIEVEPLDQARDPFCVHFEYPGTSLSPPADYNKAMVKVELSGRADGWPMTDRLVKPYIADVFPDQTGNPGLSLSCVRPERTFWEKAALIHEQLTRPEQAPLKLHQARHLSDLVRLWNAGIRNETGFQSLFTGVKAHRHGYFDYPWIDYDRLQPGDLKLVPPAPRLAEWRSDYQAMRSMFFKAPPEFDELVQQLRIIEQSLTSL